MAAKLITNIRRAACRMCRRWNETWRRHSVRAALKRNAQAADALDAAVKEMLKQ